MSKSNHTGGLYPFHQFRNSNLKSSREYLQHRQADVFLAVFHLRDVAAINPEAMCHLDLRQGAFQAQHSESATETDGNYA